ncbi:MAG: hypothetical protein PVI69_11635 [Desulfobacterales bacterium]|jgi:hypothetical protein
MDPLWIEAAFAFGAVLTRIGLPPPVGYLVAGLVLNNFGVAGGDILAKISDAGVGFSDHVCNDMDYCRLIEASKKKCVN